MLPTMRGVASSEDAKACGGPCIFTNIKARQQVRQRGKVGDIPRVELRCPNTAYNEGNGHHGARGNA